MNSLKRDSSRRAAAESQLAEYMARLVIIIARLMSSFFNPHAPYVLGLINKSMIGLEVHAEAIRQEAYN